MILGRNTQQWLGLIGAAIALAQLMIGVLKPDAAAEAAVILGGLGIFAGVFVTFIANSFTTPTSSPQLQVGTIVTATDPVTGVVVGHVKVPEPSPAPVAPDVGPEDR